MRVPQLCFYVLQTFQYVTLEKTNSDYNGLGIPEIAIS